MASLLSRLRRGELTELPQSQLQVEADGEGHGGIQAGFLYEPVSQCWVFGGGTSLTVLGESFPPCFPVVA